MKFILFILLPLSVFGQQTIPKNVHFVSPGAQLPAPAVMNEAQLMPTTIFMDWRSVLNAQTYILQRATSLMFSDAVQVYNDGPSTYQDVGLSAGTKYYYRVKARASGYNDSEWLIDSATTSSSTFDVDAQRYLDSAGIGVGTFATATHVLFFGLKTDGLWDKIICLYLMGGSSYAGSKWNARYPYNDDLAYRLVEIGSSLTYNSAGVSFNGTTQLLNTKFIAAAAGLDFTTGAHMSYYSATSAAVNNYIMGCFQWMYIAPDPDNVSAYVRMGATHNSGTKQNSLGYHIANRPAATHTQRYLHDGSVIINGASTFGNYQELTNNEIYIGGLNDASDIFSTIQCGLATIGKGLTPTDETNLRTRVTTFLTAIGR